MKLLEGNRQAIETFRNGMCEVGPDNKVYPKTDIGTISLINVFHKISDKLGQHPKEIA